MEIGERYIDGSYLDTTPNWHEGDAGWKARVIAAALGSDPAPQSICDVGCGVGGVLEELRNVFPDADLVGFDIAPRAIELARERRPDIEFRIGSIGDDDHFEVLIAADVFEHVEDYLGFIRGLRGHADRYVFHIPLDMNVQMVLRASPIRRVREKVGHLHYFSRDTALATLETAGLRVVSSEYSPGGIEAPKTAKAQLARPFRRLAHRLNPHLTARILGGYSLIVVARDA